MNSDLLRARWRKSSYSNGSDGNCVEVAALASARGVRDSKSPVKSLEFHAEAWAAFLTIVKSA